MPSYVITGTSRGLGLAFLQNLSRNPSNVVIGLVRNVAETEARISAWKTPNVHIIHGDMTNYDSLKKAAEATAAITSDTLDYLIANACYLPSRSPFDPFSVLGRDPTQLTDELLDTFKTNVIGNIHLINIFMPLILRGNVKKVVTITSGMADLDLVVKYGVHEGGPYSISKAAMNMAAAKFQVEYQQNGVLFVSISPGVVDTGNVGEMTEENIKKQIEQGRKFMTYAPHFKGPAQPDDAVKDVMKVVENASLANGYGGAFVSHLGNKEWL